MKLTYYLSKPDRLILERLEGKIDIEATFAAFQQLWKDPAYDRSFDVLMDIQEIDLQFGREEITSLVQFFSSMEEAAKGKIVAVIDAPIETAIGMMYQMKMGSEDALKIFTTLEDAFAFLGIDMENYDALDSDLATVIEVD